MCYAFYFITKETIVFKSLRLKCWEINQATPKGQINFGKNFQKRAGEGCYSRVGTKFRLQMTLLNFWNKLTQKGYFRTKKLKIANYHQILHIQINLDSKF